VDPTEDDKPLYEWLCGFRERFAAEFGDTRCDPVRLSMPEVDKRCAPVVERGVRLLMEVLEE